MSYPKLRFDANRNSESIQGVSIMPIAKMVKLTVTGDENVDFMLAPENCWVDRVIAWTVTALSQGTVELGTDGNPDALIDSADYDETTGDTVATNRGSSNADSPNGLFLAAGDQLRITVSGTDDGNEAAEFRFLIIYYPFNIMTEYHYTLEAG